MASSLATVASPRCMICGGETAAHFTKDFKGVCGLGEVRYRRCLSCGFGFSATHYAMSAEDWGDLNSQYHLSFFGTEVAADDPRWFERLNQQRDLLSYLNDNDAFPRDLAYYDYGCGDGKLSDLLKARGMTVLKYDKYLHGDHSDYLSDGDVERGGFGLAIDTSVMEHIMDLATLDGIANSVDAKRGVLAMHTWVGETVPADPAWFYLLPVHVSFFTNEAMRRLMKRWGFVASVYVVAPRVWFLFRTKRPAQRAYDLLKAVRDDAFYADGFMDYWK